MASSSSTKQPVFYTTTIWKTLVCKLSEPLAPRQCRTFGRVGIINKMTVQVWCVKSRRNRCTGIFWHYIETLKSSVSLCRCTKIIWNYVKMAELVSLHIVFRNLVVLVITSDETTWGYQALQMSCKLKHGPRYYSIPVLDIFLLVPGVSSHLCPDMSNKRIRFSKAFSQKCFKLLFR